MRKNSLLIALLPFCFILYSQPGKLFIPPEIQKAYEKGTRSPDGMPGEKYFQNQADYTINAEYFPETKLLKAQGEIIYHNNSMITLKYVVLRLHQNVFMKGGIRGRKVDPEDIHNGMILSHLEINGIKYDPESYILKTQTNLVFPLNLESGKKAKLYLEWEFTMPSKTSNRYGCYDGSSCFIAYWYPQISVYDDVSGWDLSDYTGVAEFYNDYGDYNINIQVPQNYIVWATGELSNPEKILNEDYLNKYNLAKNSDEIIHIIEKNDLNKKSAITKKGKNTWKYVASNVSDFAFGLSNNYLWDATSVEIDQPQGEKRVFIETAYNRASDNFAKVAEISAWSVKDFSVDLPGIPYPYPKLAVFNGNEGMEFPMIMNNGESDYKGTLFVTTHEIGHTYFPFLVGTNQRRHGWVDEGLITVIGMEQHLKKETTYNFREFYSEQYPIVAGTQEDIPPIVSSSFLSDDIFQIHEYMRPSLAFWTLRDILGHEMFKSCITGFIETWEGKHPTPWDMFNVFEKISGKQLSWFFIPWFFEYAYPDLEITGITIKENVSEVNIKNTGGMPFPAKLRIKLKDGSEEIYPLPAEIWTATSEYIFHSAENTIIVESEIITEGSPDIRKDNNYLKDEMVDEDPGE